MFGDNNMKKKKKKNFISEYLDEKKRLKAEEIKRKELELQNKKVEEFLKIFLAILMGIVGTLFLTLAALETNKFDIPSFLNYIQVILGVLIITLIPLLWIVRTKK